MLLCSLRVTHDTLIECGMQPYEKKTSTMEGVERGKDRERGRERERHSGEEDEPVWQGYVTVQHSSRRPDGRRRRGKDRGPTFLM